MRKGAAGPGLNAHVPVPARPRVQHRQVATAPAASLFEQGPGPLARRAESNKMVSVPSVPQAFEFAGDAQKCQQSQNDNQQQLHGHLLPARASGYLKLNFAQCCVPSLSVTCSSRHPRQLLADCQL